VVAQDPTHRPQRDRGKKKKARKEGEILKNVWGKGHFSSPIPYKGRRKASTHPRLAMLVGRGEPVSGATRKEYARENFSSGDWAEKEHGGETGPRVCSLLGVERKRTGSI